MAIKAIELSYVNLFPSFYSLHVSMLKLFAYSYVVGFGARWTEMKSTGKAQLLTTFTLTRFRRLHLVLLLGCSLSNRLLWFALVKAIIQIVEKDDQRWGKVYFNLEIFIH